jgi:hypothetical protein
MQSTRMLSLIIFFLTFGLFVSGNPVPSMTNELAKRCDTCSSGETTAINALLKLQVDVNAELAILGTCISRRVQDENAYMIIFAFSDKVCAAGGSPVEGVAKIIVLVNACADVIAKIKVDASTTITEGKKQIASIVASILVVRTFVLRDFKHLWIDNTPPCRASSCACPSSLSSLPSPCA